MNLSLYSHWLSWPATVERIFRCNTFSVRVVYVLGLIILDKSSMAHIADNCKETCPRIMFDEKKETDSFIFSPFQSIRGSWVHGSVDLEQEKRNI